MAKPRDDIDPAMAIAGMRTTHIHCRDFGHSWRPYSVNHIPQRSVYEEVLRCVRCHTHRVRVITHTGRQVGSRYVYAPDYLVPGMGRLVDDDRDRLRLASLEKMLAQVGQGPDLERAVLRGA